VILASYEHETRKTRIVDGRERRLELSFLI
jgi:hypothetical protein